MNNCFEIIGLTVKKDYQKKHDSMVIVNKKITPIQQNLFKKAMVV